MSRYNSYFYLPPSPYSYYNPYQYYYPKPWYYDPLNIDTIYYYDHHKKKEDSKDTGTCHGPILPNKPRGTCSDPHKECRGGLDNQYHCVSKQYE